MKVTRAHGGGGEETARLIDEVFMAHFRNAWNAPMADAAVLNLSGRAAFTTDTFVVTPIFFPGGDIGRLSVCGTVNDLLTAGAEPKYLSVGFVLGEGLDLDDLRAVCRSLADAAAEAGVAVVTGDTKVVDGRGELFINTTGIGVVRGEPVSFADARAGDSILVTGTLGDHHACILGRRMSVENGVASDAAPLVDIVGSLISAGVPLRGMRDITRGGLATVLSEIAGATGLAPVVEESAIPVSPEVASFAKILGLDPLHMANEGKMLIVVPRECRDKALALIREARYGAAAAAIGVMEQGAWPQLLTRLGGRRILTPARGEQLPRIC